MLSKLYTIKFTDGTELEEYGYGEQDIRNFCSRCYSERVVESITLAS